MKKNGTMMLIAGLLVTICAMNASAQSKAENTASAKAYYDYHNSKPKIKSKKKAKQKPHQVMHTQPARGTRADWSTKRKLNHS
jgi:hypothetical protein